MTLAELHIAVRELAQGRYFAVKVESSENNGKVTLEWGIYMAGPGFLTSQWPEDVLAAMRTKLLMPEQARTVEDLARLDLTPPPPPPPDSAPHSSHASEF